jgi:hypothetical protein
MFHGMLLDFLFQIGSGRQQSLPPACLPQIAYFTLWQLEHASVSGGVAPTFPDKMAFLPVAT